MSLNIIIDADVTQASQTISKFSYEIKKSFGSINTVIDKTATGFQYGTNKMAESTKSFAKASQNSLTAVSLAIQDLPFGFIGIQNNLPGIIQGLGQMTEVAKTGTPIMTQLVGSLMGPAGLFLAFSAVTSIVTTLTMKYGSFGEAMNAIFGKVDALSGKIKELSESYKEFNKQLKTSQDIVGEEKASTLSTISEVQTLSKIILNQTKSYNERNAALNRLKEINKDYFGNLTLETLKTNTLTDAVTAYKDSLLQGSIAKGFQEQANKTNIELSKQQILLEQLQDALDAARRAPAKINRVTGEETSNKKAIDDAQSAYNAQLKVVNELKKRKSELNKEIKNSVEAQIALRAPVDAATAALEKQKKADEALKKEKEWQDKWAMSWYKNNGKALGQQEAFSRFVVGATNMQVSAIDKLIKARVKYRKETSKEKATELVPTTISGEAKILKNKKFLDTQAIAAEFALAKEVIDGVFFNPIAESFENFINTGKFTFDEFAKNIKANIAKIVAQIAASKIVELLGTIFAGPIAGGLSQGGGFLSAIGNILPAFRANTRFEGVRPLATGGGQKIDLVLRGTDLVGSINRTNAQISRVG